MKYSNLKMGVKEDLHVALVTGATGLVGQNVCLELAKNHWKIGLVVHDNVNAARALLQKVRTAGGEGVVIQGNLLEPAIEVPRIVSECKAAFGPAYFLIHAASLPVTTSSFLEVPADLNRMLTLHVTAYLTLVAALLPDMLRVQSGVFLSILSQALLPPYIPGWHAYSIAKAALAQATNEIAVRYESAGLRSVAVMPGALKSDQGSPQDVDKNILDTLRGRWPLGIEAHKVAEVILDVIQNEKIISGSVVNFDAKMGVQVGRCVLWVKNQPDGSEQKKEKEVEKTQTSSQITQQHSASDSDSVVNMLSVIFGELFELEDQVKIENAEIGVTKGWDSLAHIRLIMEVESALNIQFSSDEVSELTSFSGILQRVRVKLL